MGVSFFMSVCRCFVRSLVRSLLITSFMYVFRSFARYVCVYFLSYLVVSLIMYVCIWFVVLVVMYVVHSVFSSSVRRYLVIP